jgi:SNF2 family DNA or RNA helicase
VIVPVDRFLSKRAWLGQMLTTYACEAHFDSGVVALLSRADDERTEVTAALVDRLAILTEGDVQDLLDVSRFTRELRDFQLHDLARILSLSHGANFSVPGAGKTAVAYATYEAERQRGRVDRLLVIAPLSAYDAWIEEAEECLEPTPVVSPYVDKVPRSAEVLLVNYQRLAGHFDEIAEWVLSHRCHVILDEAHRMKRGRQGEWGNACLDLAHIAVRRDILTGTPAPQHPADFVALLDYLWPNQSTRILPSAALQKEPPPDAMTDVSNRIRPLFSRTRKNQLGLRKPRLRVERVHMKDLQAEIYAALRSQYRGVANVDRRDQELVKGIGEITMYLLEAATNPSLLAGAIGGSPSGSTWPSAAIPEGSPLSEKILNYAEFETPAKFEKLASLVSSNASIGRKTLVWTNFVTNLLDLSERVLAPHQPAVVYGGVPSSREEVEGSREAEIRRFRSDDKCMALIANPAAMAEGISLHHTCHDAIYVERTFNAGQYLQSLDRIHRLGLPSDADTRITFLVCENTIDEVIDQRVRIKAERLGEMLTDPDLVTMALPDEEAYGNWIDVDDLDALFGHLMNDA